MPAQTSQSINDGAATPVAHVFAPQGVIAKGGELIATWLNRAASALTGGAERLVMYFRTKNDGSLSFRVVTLLPITESVSGLNVVTRTLRATTTVEVSANATAQNRKDILALHRNALASATNIGAAIENGEAVY